MRSIIVLISEMVRVIRCPLPIAKKQKQLKLPVSRRLCAAILAVVLVTAPIAAHAMGDEEFVGPFPNWKNVQTDYGARGDGVTDDTAAIQNALNNLNQTNPTLYFPAGTYIISQTLTLTGQVYVNLIGEDPANTAIIWGGASGGTMLANTGIAYSRFDRLTFDGQNSAAILVDQDWPGSVNYFDTGNEYADDVFENAGIGLRCGNTAGCADTSMLRDKFIKNTTVGILLRNYNALDMWVWYSLFQNNPRAITNVAGGRSAGQFHVFNSIFQGSTIADASTANTFGTTNLRGNYSIGSRRFWEGGGSGAVEPITIQGNTILDPTDPHAIYEWSSGPIVMIDNVIRSSGDTPVAEVPPDRTPAAGGIFSMGNTFTVGSGTCTTSAPVYSTGPCHEIDDQIVSPSAVNPPMPTLPGTPPNLHRTIYEASDVAGIVSGIASAAAICDNSVVHIQPGNYNVSSTITVPANCPMQIIGDGGNTYLAWAGSGAGPLLRLAGPSKAILRDFRLHGNGVAAGIEIAGADQSGARVFMEQAILSQGSPNLFVDALDYTNVEFHDSQFVSARSGYPSIDVVGGPSATAGSWLGGATNVFAALSWGQDFVYRTANAHLLLRDIWNEASTTSLNSVAHLTGGGAVTISGTMLSQSIAAPYATAGAGSNTLTLNGLGGISAGMYVGTSTGEFPDHDAIDSINTANNTVHIVSPILAPLSNTQVRVYLPSGISMNNFSGTAALINNFTFGDTSITGTPSSAPNVLALQSGSGTFFNNTSSPAAVVELLNSTNNIDFNNYLSVPEQNCCDATFLRTTLNQLRTTQPTLPLSLPSGVTDARFYRVFVDQFINDIHLKADPVSILNGSCGSAYGVAVSTAPTANLCGSGTASAVSGTGPWTWSCAGGSGGTTAECSAPVLVNGSCGSASGVAVSTAPTTNLCGSGTASAVSGTGPWTWSCASSNGGATAECSAPLLPQPVNGQCGPANGGSFTSAPATNLCNAGTTSAVTGSGPWSWTCAGSNGGSNAGCSASVLLFQLTAAASPASIQPGQTEQLTATAMPYQTGSGYTLTFTVTLNGAALASQNYTGLSFTAGKAYTKTWGWTVPSGAAPGAYAATVTIQKNGTSYVNAQTSFTVTGPKINGQCGSANGSHLASAPSTNLCKAGAPTSVTGSGPWKWSCLGSNGGSSQSCSASPK